jgi:flavin-dependent thymidylate synthase
MKVTLIYATPGAVDLLIFTKNTRLNLSPGLYEEIEDWSEERKMQELEYISKTVPSSHEFVDLIFCIEDVTRAFTHQLVRTRTASYAQQAMRVANMSGFGYYTGPSIDKPERKAVYDSVMRTINQGYQTLLEEGATAEDARGVLPTNIYTNIVAKYNLRNFADLVIKRSDGRVQNEYKQVLALMVEEVRKVWPWADMFITPRENESFKAVSDYLEQQVTNEHDEYGVPMAKTKAWEILKELNMIRKAMNS